MEKPVENVHNFLNKLEKHQIWGIAISVKVHPFQTYCGLMCRKMAAFVVALLISNYSAPRFFILRVRMELLQVLDNRGNFGILSMLEYNGKPLVVYEKEGCNNGS